MPETNSPPQPLSGFNVIEIGNSTSVSYCCKMMADQGAFVIKVEDPRFGETDRKERILPDGDEPGCLFAYVNCNKFGVTLNIETAPGQKVFHDLVGKADILVQGYSPKQAAKLGVDYETLCRVNPRLIETSITSFGQTGPYREYKAYAINLSAAGASSICVGEKGRTPLPLPVSQIHYQSAAVSAAATLGGLLTRELTGRAQHIDISEAEVWLTHHTGHAVIAFVFYGRKRMRSGHKTQALFPNGILHCKDGYISLITIRGKQWKEFLKIVGDGEIPEWYSSDSRFTETSFRELNLKYGDEIEANLEEWLMQHPKNEIYELGRKHHVPLAPVRDVREVLEDPHLKERKFFKEIEDPQFGKIKYPSSALRFSKTPSIIHRPAPKLGQHNEEIYCEHLGYSKEYMNQLNQNSVI